jgi:hypothetical protein
MQRSPQLRGKVDAGSSEKLSFRSDVPRGLEVYLARGLPLRSEDQDG